MLLRDGVTVDYLLRDGVTVDNLLRDGVTVDYLLRDGVTVDYLRDGWSGVLLRDERKRSALADVLAPVQNCMGGSLRSFSHGGRPAAADDQISVMNCAGGSVHPSVPPHLAMGEGGAEVMMADIHVLPA